MTDLVSSHSDYVGIHGDIVALLESTRLAAARSVNALMTASYWELADASSSSNNAGRIGRHTATR